jgi:Outer membrane protein
MGYGLYIIFARADKAKTETSNSSPENHRKRLLANTYNLPPGCSNANYLPRANGCDLRHSRHNLGVRDRSGITSEYTKRGQFYTKTVGRDRLFMRDEYDAWKIDGALIMLIRQLTKILFGAAAFIVTLSSIGIDAQSPTPASQQAFQYLDQAGGMTADQSVVLALENNGEIQALRKEVEAARALVKQAGLRPNPKVTAGGTKQINGADNNQTAEVMLPLELGGRRGARIAVAQAELEIREFALANQERLLASEVRAKFGESLGLIKKLELTVETLTTANQGYQLVSAKVTEGKIAPLEQNMFLVEVNRLKAIRETAIGKTDVAMLELRNMIGMKPEDPLRLRGDFENLIASLPPITEDIARALSSRPDLQGAKAVDQLASARVQQAKAEGRIDAGIKSGYQRMNSSFPVSGFDDHGILRPVQDIFHFFTFGVEIDLPVRNRNQGAIEAALFDREAAQRRIEFGELTIHREVAAALAKYDAAARALSIVRGGVRDQSRENLEVIWQTYELGSRSLLDYISEQRRFLEVENSLVESELETYQAKVELMRATNAPELTNK